MLELKVDWPKMHKSGQVFESDRKFDQPILMEQMRHINILRNIQVCLDEILVISKGAR